MTIKDNSNNVLVKTFTVSVSSKKLVWRTVSSVSKPGGSWSITGHAGTGTVKKGGTWSTGGRITAGTGWAGASYALNLTSLTVPSNAVTRRIVAYVNGRTPSALGLNARLGIYNTTLGSYTIVQSYDTLTQLPRATATTYSMTRAPASHRSGKTVRVLVYVPLGVYDVRWVKVVYSYATLQ